MLKAELVSCQISMPAGAEAGALDCVMPDAGIDWTSMVDSAGTWATAIATVLLAFFAWLAWKNSRKTLDAMRQQEETSFRIADEQMNALKRSSDEERQERASAREVEALSDYLQQWYSVLAQSTNGKANMREMLRKVVSAGIIWRMLHWDRRDQLAPALELEGLLADSVSQNHPGRGYLPYSAEALLKDSQTIGFLMDDLQRWQMKPEERGEVGLRLRELAAAFKSENPEVFDLVTSGRR